MLHPQNNHILCEITRRAWDRGEVDVSCLMNRHYIHGLAASARPQLEVAGRCHLQRHVAGTHLTLTSTSVGRVATHPGSRSSHSGHWGADMAVTPDMLCLHKQLFHTQVTGLSAGDTRVTASTYIIILNSF
jgi:hypothetical protein